MSNTKVNYICFMRDFSKLTIWQRSHQLTLRIYELTRSFPKNELYGITSQIRRASLSIPTNIAEGCGRSSEKELARFLTIAAGSLSEVQYLLILSSDLKFISKDDFDTLNKVVVEIRKMLYSYHRKLI